jgi:hypothetical protein
MCSQWRQTPPNAATLLFKPQSLPCLALVGVLGVAVLVAVGLPIAWPFFVAGMVVGAASRDIGFAVKAAKYWPTQSQLLDWKKIEEIVGAGANSDPIQQ